MKTTPSPTHITVQTRYGPLPIHRNWMQSKAARKQAYTRTRNRT